MFKIEPRQSTFVFGDEVFAKMIPEDHFLRKVNRTIDFSRVNDLCKDLYSEDEGRPVTNTPEKMMRASFIQTCYDLSDRHLEENVNYNLAYRWFVGLNLDDDVFHFSALSNFRLKLGEERFQAIFNDILEQAYEKGLIDRNEPVLSDATHIIADIAIPSTIGLIQGYIKKILSIIHVEAPGMMNELPEEMRPYMPKKKDWRPKEHTLTEGQKKDRLTEVTEVAIKLIKWYESLDSALLSGMGESVKKEIDCLNKILHDYLERKRGRGRPPKNKDPILDGNGKIKEREKKGEGRTVSPHDPDARHGAKSKTKHFTGYKAQSMQTRSGVTVAVETITGDVVEGERLFPQLDEMAKLGIEPPKAIADKLYGSEDNRKEAEEREMVLSSPIKESVNPTGLFSRTFFSFQGDVVICPGCKIAACSSHHKDRFYFCFDKDDCQNCQLKMMCTNAPSRTVSFTENYDVVQRAAQYQATDEAEQDRKDRTAIERTYSEVKGSHGLVRARYRTRARVAIQVFLTFIVTNVKRLVVLAEKKATECKKALIGNIVPAGAIVPHEYAC